MKDIYETFTEFTEQQNFILDNRINNPKMTLREIGEKYGLTSETIRVKECQIKRILRYNSFLKKLKDINTNEFKYEDSSHSLYTFYLYWFDDKYKKIRKTYFYAFSVFKRMDVLDYRMIKKIRKQGWGSNYTEEEILDFIKRIAISTILYHKDINDIMEKND